MVELGSPADQVIFMAWTGGSRLSKKRLMSLNLAFFILFSLVSSEKDHSAGTAHVHGQAKLQAVLDNTRFEIELRLPAYDIVGFESQPKNRKQENAVRVARQKLGNFDELFEINSQAKCKLNSKETELESIKQEKDEAHRALEEAHGHKHPAGEHWEFKAHYSLSCKSPSLIRELSVDLFDEFASIQSIHYQIVGSPLKASGQLTPQSSRVLQSN